MSWRLGSKFPINVYDGDRPVCQCQTAMDAMLIVQSVNHTLWLQRAAPETLKTWRESERAWRESERES